MKKTGGNGGYKYRTKVKDTMPRTPRTSRANVRAGVKKK